MMLVVGLHLGATVNKAGQLDCRSWPAQPRLCWQLAAGAGTHPRCPPSATASAAGSSRPPNFFTPAQSMEVVAAFC